MRIDLPDDVGATLQAKAAAQGLSLENWFRQLAQSPIESVRRPKKSAYGLLAEYGPGPTEEEIDESRKEMFRGFAEDAP